MPRTVYYAAISADGFIATTDGGVAWLDPFHSPELGYEEFLAGVGAVVLGRATYEQALGFGPWPYAGRSGLVVTSRAIADLPGGVRTVAVDELAAAVQELRATTAGDVWIVGGSKTARACLDAGVIDELELYAVPRLLGAGIPLFELRDGENPELGDRTDYGLLRLVQTRAFSNGVVMHRYAVEQRATS